MNDEIASKIQSLLASTEWKVTSLNRVSGGNANFTYRGQLEKQNGTIFIKHAEPFAALNQAYALDASRSDFEWLMLQTLSDKPAAKTGQFEVRTPKVLGSYGTTKVIEDLPNSLTIKAFLSQYGESIEKNVATSLGAALGNWLASFHKWLNGDEDKAKTTREKLRKNPLIGPRAELYIGSYKSCMDEFPQLEWPTEAEFAAIEKYVRDMYNAGDEAIHGDFWTGNMILKDEPLLTAGSDGSRKVFILDFEVSQHGSRAQDLAQCLAELWMVHHFYGAEAPLHVMQGFVDAYFVANSDVPATQLAFQIAIHFGVHIVVIPTRYGWPKGERLDECVRIGNGCLVKGYAQEKEWFSDGPLAFLFRHGDA